MKYLLDTNVVVSIIRGDLQVRGNFAECARRSGLASLCVSRLTAYELAVGIEKSRQAGFANSKRVLATEAILKELTMVEFVEEESHCASKCRAYLESQGRKIGALDNLIAGTALAHDLILVTANLKEFNRVPNLQCESWA